MRRHHPYARWRRLRSFIACRRPRTFVDRDSSCCDAIVVSSSSSSSVCSLATIAVYRCFSSLSDNRSSLLGSRSSSSFIRSFARIATVHCVSLSEDDRSVSCVLRSSIVRGRLGFVSRRPSSLVCRRSCVIACLSSFVVAGPSLVRCRSGIVVIRSLVDKYCDPSLFVVSRGRSVVFTQGFCVVWLYDAGFRNMSFGMSGFRFVFFCDVS